MQASAHVLPLSAQTAGLMCVRAVPFNFIQLYFEHDPDCSCALQLCPSVTGVDAREWCKRMGRTLAAILDPLGTGHTAAAGAPAAGGPAFAIGPPPTTSGAGAKAAQLPGGYNAVAGFSALGFGGGSSSDESSGDESEVRRMTREQRLQRKLGLDGKKKGAAKPAGMYAEVLQCTHVLLEAYVFVMFVK